MPPSETTRAGASRAGAFRAGAFRDGAPAEPQSAGPQSAGPQPAGSRSAGSQPAGSQPAAPDRSGGPDRLAVLLERARDGGDRSGLDGIVAELTPLLWQVARAQGLDRDAAEDVVQTTWLSLLRHLDGIRSAGALTAWLVTVAKREAWRVRKAGRSERQMEDWAEDTLPDPDPLPEDQVLADDQRRALWQAVRRLSQRCQELLRVVAFVRRPDYTELSAVLGMPPGSIGPTRGRCLAKLRQLLSADPTWSPL
jgi:RNA polymerase sigma factor (sigma-70 family)